MLIGRSSVSLLQSVAAMSTEDVHNKMGDAQTGSEEGISLFPEKYLRYTSKDLLEREFPCLARKWKKKMWKAQDQKNSLLEDRYYEKYNHYYQRDYAMKNSNPDLAKEILDRHLRKMNDLSLSEVKRSRQPIKAAFWDNYIKERKWKYDSREHEYYMEQMNSLKES